MAQKSTSLVKIVQTKRIYINVWAYENTKTQYQPKKWMVRLIKHTDIGYVTTDRRKRYCWNQIIIQQNGFQKKLLAIEIWKQR